MVYLLEGQSDEEKYLGEGFLKSVKRKIRTVLIPVGSFRRQPLLPMQQPSSEDTEVNRTPIALVALSLAVETWVGKITQTRN